MIYLFILYSFQGILYGLQVKFLPVILRTKGRSLLFIGSLNVFSLPWLAKSAIAPLIDLYCTTTWWLRLTITGTATCLVFLHLSQDLIGVFAVVLFVLNVFSACHDVVVGKLLLSASTTGHKAASKGSSIQILAYKTGVILGGGVMLWISSSTFVSHYIFIILAILLVLLLFIEDCESKPEVKTLDKNHRSKPEVSRNHSITGQKVKQANAALLHIYLSISSGSTWLIMCLLLYKYASHSCNMLFTMVLVDQGVTMETIGITSGIVGNLLSLAVAMVTGAMLTRTRSVTET